MHPISAHFPVPLCPSFMLVASSPTKYFFLKKLKPNKQKPTLLLRLSCLSNTSSFILVALGALVAKQYTVLHY